MKIDETSKYLLAIVGIVALVGVVSLLANSGGTAMLVGATTTSSTCTDSDGGMVWTTKGTVSGGTWKTTGKAYTINTDYCNPKGYLVELYCSDSTHAFSTTQSCATKVGAGYTCQAGACVIADADGDGVADAADVCPGYNDKVDTDSDGTPDGCDTDDDGDGYSDAEEVTTGTDPLDASDYPVDLPDLVLDSVSLSLVPGGVMYVYTAPNGTSYSVKNNVTANVTLSIKNAGTAGVSTSIRSKHKIVSTERGWFSWAAGDSELRGLATGATREITAKTNVVEPLLVELYINSTYELPYNYSIDYYSFVSGSSWFGVNESNELNNNGTGTYTLSGSSITFIAAECAATKDCPTDCVCSTTDYNCYETYTSGGSTYTSTTPC